MCSSLPHQSETAGVSFFLQFSRDKLRNRDTPCGDTQSKALYLILATLPSMSEELDGVGGTARKLEFLSICEARNSEDSPFHPLATHSLQSQP